VNKNIHLVKTESQLFRPNEEWHEACFCANVDFSSAKPMKLLHLEIILALNSLYAPNHLLAGASPHWGSLSATPDRHSWS